MSQLELNAEARDTKGRSASRRLRHEAKIPAIIYGGGKEPQQIALDEPSTFRFLNNEKSYSSIINISIDGAVEPAIVKDVQRHPYKPKLTHVDFQRVNAGETLRVHVPLHFLNEAAPVKAGGVVSHHVIEVEVLVLPKDLPEFIEVDLGEMRIGDSLHLSDIKMPEGAELAELARGEGHDQTIVTIAKPRGAADEEESADGEEGEAPAAE